MRIGVGCPSLCKGLMRIENLNLHTIHSCINYDWDRNRLQIVFYVRTKKMVYKASAKKICENITAKINSTFGGEIRDKGLRRNISIAAQTHRSVAFGAARKRAESLSKRWSALTKLKMEYIETLKLMKSGMTTV